MRGGRHVLGNGDRSRVIDDVPGRTRGLAMDIHAVRQNHGVIRRILHDGLAVDHTYRAAGLGLGLRSLRIHLRLGDIDRSFHVLAVHRSVLRWVRGILLDHNQFLLRRGVAAFLAHRRHSHRCCTGANRRRRGLHCHVLDFGLGTFARDPVGHAFDLDRVHSAFARDHYGAPLAVDIDLSLLVRGRNVEADILDRGLDLGLCRVLGLGQGTARKGLLHRKKEPPVAVAAAVAAAVAGEDVHQRGEGLRLQKTERLVADCRRREIVEGPLLLRERLAGGLDLDLELGDFALSSLGLHCNRQRTAAVAIDLGRMDQHRSDCSGLDRLQRHRLVGMLRLDHSANLGLEAPGLDQLGCHIDRGFVGLSRDLARLSLPSQAALHLHNGGPREWGRDLDRGLNRARWGYGVEVVVIGDGACSLDGECPKDDQDDLGPDGLDPDGLDPDGLDPDGLDPDGLDSDGLDPDGLDPDGLDPDDLDPDDVGLDGSDPDDLGPDDVGLDGLDPDDLGPDDVGLDGLDPDDLGPGDVGFDGLDLDDLGPNGGWSRDGRPPGHYEGHCDDSILCRHDRGQSGVDLYDGYLNDRLREASCPHDGRQGYHLMNE
jgi:hypothetical protein